MIAALSFLIVAVALALPGLIVRVFEFGDRTHPQTFATSPPALRS